MILDRLEVDHVRNIGNLSLELEPGINLLTGPNGAGKTSLLEAVHLLVRGKSFRRGGLESQISHSADDMAIRGRFNTDESSFRLDFTKRRGTPLELRLDRRRVQRISEIVSLVPIQTFLPDLAELIFGAPIERRKWLDLGVLYESSDALRTMAHFRHVLRQRNAALRTRQVAQLDAWDFELVASAEALTALRRRCFENMVKEVASSASQLCPELELSMRFFPGYRGEEFAEELRKQRPRDVQLRMTNSGPHRADVHVRISVDGRQRRALPSAAVLVSQGQARALAAAFKLGQVQHLKSLGYRSLLLVDDLGSEWDDIHFDRFLNLMAKLGSQVLSSAVSTSLLPDDWVERITRFELNKGNVL
ncbi:MAG: DNA replication and repair protein RecF [Gammaproteobacteria bacterium]|nr:DNA replication and repair protein RecF [Gammaproteobacteria bacterium]